MDRKPTLVLQCILHINDTASWIRCCLQFKPNYSRHTSKNLLVQNFTYRRKCQSNKFSLTEFGQTVQPIKRVSLNLEKQTSVAHRKSNQRIPKSCSTF